MEYKRHDEVEQPYGPVFVDVYFDERHQVIDNRLGEMLQHIARLLTSETDWQLQIEGHCDPRGSAAYNLARAEFQLGVLKRYFRMLGVVSHKIHAVNYGQDPSTCRNDRERCREDNLRAHQIFPRLAIRHTQRGCLMRLRLQASRDWPSAARDVTPYPSNVQRIQVASPIRSIY